jgi:hypothetical protein
MKIIKIIIILFSCLPIGTYHKRQFGICLLWNLADSCHFLHEKSFVCRLKLYFQVKIWWNFAPKKTHIVIRTKIYFQVFKDIKLYTKFINWTILVFIATYKTNWSFQAQDVIWRKNTFHSWILWSWSFAIWPFFWGTLIVTIVKIITLH